MGFIIYVASPHFWVFMLAEFILALGFAFISGADVAWLYELLDQAKAREHFRLVHVVYDNAYVFGMLVSAPLTGLAVRIFSLRWVFALQSVSFALAALLLAFLTPSPRVSAHESLTPRYVDFIKQGAQLLAKSKQLKFLVAYLIPLKVAGYFVIWLYQGVLSELKVPIEAFGLYRAYLLAIQLVVSGIVLWLFKRIKAPRSLKILLLSFPILIMVSYVSLAIAPGIASILIFLTFAGGIGLRISTIMSKEINELIPSEIRATALSFIGMLRKVVLTLLNPVVGASVDHFGFSPVLLGLGGMMVVPVVVLVVWGSRQNRKNRFLREPLSLSFFWPSYISPP